MAHTLVAMFDNARAARSAQRALSAAGFDNAQLFREEAGRFARRAAAPEQLCVLTLLLADALKVAEAARILQPFSPDAIDAAMAARFLALDPDSFN